jgi:cellulose synthase/poly-beta-1,6-N-acetylglucosamine synthase-like glycosyltransferase
MEFLFWLFFGLVAWCFAGYPASMLVRARLRGSREPEERVDRRSGSRESDGSDRERALPFVSVVVAVRNEADRIRSRVRNLLDQDYPGDRIEVVVVCNGCDDGPVEVAWGLARANRRVRLLGSPRAEGKAGALNRGVAAARGDVVVFADARQRFAPDAVRRLVGALARPDVGAASGRLEVTASDSTSLEGVRRYWDLETRLRLAESATGSVVGATGAIYAIRRELFHPLPPGLILDDVYLPMKIVGQGWRVVLEPSAVATDAPAADQRSEFGRKVRTAVGNLQLLRLMPELLVPWRNPVFGRYVSHKLLRLMSPVCLTGTLVLGLWLGGVVYGGIALAQAGFYALGAVGLLAPVPKLDLPAAFLLVHAALACALVRPARGAETVWSRRA